MTCQDHLVAAKSAGGWKEIAAIKKKAEFIICPCGGSYSEATKDKHSQTKVHKRKFPDGNYPFLQNVASSNSSSSSSSSSNKTNGTGEPTKHIEDDEDDGHEYIEEDEEDNDLAYI
jgi:hypothetical protein